MWATAGHPSDLPKVMQVVHGRAGTGSAAAGDGHEQLLQGIRRHCVTPAFAGAREVPSVQGQSQGGEKSFLQTLSAKELARHLESKNHCTVPSNAFPSLWEGDGDISELKDGRN